MLANKRRYCILLILTLILPLHNFRVLADANKPNLAARQTVKDWIEELKSDNNYTRLSVAHSLNQDLVGDRSAILDLIRGLEDTNPFVRKYIAHALGEVGNDYPLTIPKLISALQDDDRSVRDRATVALVKIGKPAVPGLIDYLTRNHISDLPSKTLIERQKKENLIVNRIKEKECDSFSGVYLPSFHAALALKEIGISSIPALSRLWKTTMMKLDTFKLQQDDSNYKEWLELSPYVLFALISQEKAGVEAVDEALFHSNADIQRAILLGLAQLDTDITPAIPELLELLTNSNEWTRRYANRVLRNKAAQIDSSFSFALVDLLNHETAKANAASILNKMGQKAKPVVPQLIALLEDEELETRYQAIEILGSIGWPARESVPQLLELTAHEDKNLSILAIENLGRIGSDRFDVVPTLIEYLNAEKNIALAAIEALGHFPSHSSIIVPELLPYLSQEDPNYEVARTLGKLRLNPDLVLPTTVKLLNSKNEYIQTNAIKVLSNLGAEAKITVPQLIELLSNKEISWYMRNEIIDAIIEIKIIGDRSIAKLLKLLDSQNEETRSDAARILAGIEYRGFSVPQSIALLQDKNYSIRNMASTILAAVGNESNGAVYRLIELLDNENSFAIAVDTLKRMGTKARAAIPSLLSYLDSSEVHIRKKVADAISEIGISNTDSVAILSNYLNDSDYAVNVKLTTAMSNANLLTSSTQHS